MPQNNHEKNTCFVRGVLLTISAPSKGQACNAQKHKNRKRRAQGARAYAIHVRFPRIAPRGYLYSFLPDIQD